MNKINDGGPGMLAVDMTLRDYLAAQFAAAMMTATSADRDFPNIDYRRDVGGPTMAERVATIAYRMADAMIRAREASKDEAIDKAIAQRPAARPPNPTVFVL